MLSLLGPKTEFDPPSLVYAFLKSPAAFAARIMYKSINFLRPLPTKSKTPIKVVCISDTHTQTLDVPDGDLLIHAGDLTNAGTVNEIQAQIDWLDSLPHRAKVAIAGNHDTFLDPRSRQTLDTSNKIGVLDWKGIHYLQHAMITLTFPNAGHRKLNVYGAPQIPACGGPDFAFQYTRGRDAWSDTVPNEIDILVTHIPPKAHLDLPVGLGCEFLLQESWRVRPRLHVCGHIHAGRGTEVLWWNQCQASYERVCARSGSITSILKPSNWIDIIRICLFGVRDIMWSVLWGGEAQGGLLINAAVMNQATDRVEFPPQVVQI